MAPQSQLTKNCISCSLPKPLTAYLQIAGPQGTSYGTICAACRGSSTNRTIVIPTAETDERHASGSTGLRIDAKTKAFLDQERRTQQQNKQEITVEETKKREHVKDELLERKEQKFDAEQKHRQDYIEPKKKAAFLNYQSKKPDQRGIPATTRDVTNAKQATDQHRILDALQKHEGAKHEENAKSINFSESYVDPSQSEVKFQSAEYLKVKAWLGAGTAARTYERQFLTSSTTTPAAAQTKKAATENTHKPVAEALTDALKPTSPNSTRRRN